jgi:Cys-rich protein (TIGR01571 family)
MSYAKHYEPESYGNPQGANSYAQAQAVPQQNSSGQYAQQGSVPVVVNQQPGYSTSEQGNVDPYAPGPRRQPPPIGRWADGICDWPSNLFPSCYCVCCILQGSWILAQIAEKVGCLKFSYVMWSYALVILISLIIEIAAPGSSAIVWGPSIFIFVFQICLRLHIVKKHQIQECSNNPAMSQLGECLCACCCCQCSMCQMARYVYGYSKVFDGDGDVYRGDNWAV